MTTVIFQRADGKAAGDTIDLPRARRRLSAIVKRHADRTRPHIVCVYRKGETWAPTDFSVRMRKQWSSTRIGPNDTVAIIYAPRGGGGGAAGGGRAGKAAGIGLLVATIALAAVGHFWAIGLMTPMLGAQTAGFVWAAASAGLPAGPSFFISRNKEASHDGGECVSSGSHEAR